jgi:hypothetical protein
MYAELPPTCSQLRPDRQPGQQRWRHLRHRLRPWYYPKEGETLDEAVLRACTATPGWHPADRPHGIGQRRYLAGANAGTRDLQLSQNALGRSFALALIKNDENSSARP